MLRSVEDVAIQLGVSKTAIYNKLKLKEFKGLVVKKNGRSMIDDDLFNSIKDSLKCNINFNNEKNKNSVNDEIATDRTDLFNLNNDLFNTLLEQLKEKDRQISELHKLIENNQVLLKQEKEVNQLQLEDHIRELDVKLNNVKENMKQRKKRKSLFFKKQNNPKIE